MHKQPHNGTTTPPGQVVNLEVPRTKAVEAFRDDQFVGASTDYLRGYKHGLADAKDATKNLRDSLKYERSQRLHWYLEAMKYKAIVEKYTKFA